MGRSGDFQMPGSREDTGAHERLIDGELIDFDAPAEQQGSEAIATGTSSRRRFERVACTKTVRLTELDDFGNPGSTWECRIADLSRAGAGLRSRRMVHSG